MKIEKFMRHVTKKHLTDFKNIFFIHTVHNEYNTTIIIFLKYISARDHMRYQMETCFATKVYYVNLI